MRAVTGQRRRIGWSVSCGWIRVRGSGERPGASLLAAPSWARATRTTGSTRYAWLSNLLLGREPARPSDVPGSGRSAEQARFDGLLHSHERHGYPTGCVKQPFERSERVRGIERLAGERGHQLESREPFGCGSRLAKRQDESTHATAGVGWIRIHGANARRLDCWVEQVTVTTRRLVAAVEGRPPAPATAAGDVGVRLDDEVRAVIDQLGVDPHDRPAGSDLGVVEKRPLQLRDRLVHQRRQLWNVCWDRQATRELHGLSLSK